MSKETQNNVLLGVGVIIGVALLVGGCYLLVTIPNASANFRDFLIILLAIESMVVFAFLGLMLWQLYQLVKLLRDEVIPLITTTKETVEQVKHTTTFVGQSVAAPVIGVTGMITGAKAMVDTLRGIRPPEAILRREDRTDG